MCSLIDSSRTGHDNSLQLFVSLWAHLWRVHSMALSTLLDAESVSAKGATEKKKKKLLGCPLSLMQQPGDVAFKLLTFLNSFVSWSGRETVGILNALPFSFFLLDVLTLKKGMKEEWGKKREEEDPDTLFSQFPYKGWGPHVLFDWR